MQYFKTLKWIFGTIICVGMTTTCVEPSRESGGNGQSSPQSNSRRKRACHVSKKCLTHHRWPKAGITPQSGQADHASRKHSTRPLRVQAPSHHVHFRLGSRGTGRKPPTPTLVGAAANRGMDQSGLGIKNDYGRRRAKTSTGNRLRSKHAAADAARTHAAPASAGPRSLRRHRSSTSLFLQTVRAASTK